MQPTHMRSVAFLRKFTSSSRISANHSDLLKLPIMSTEDVFVFSSYYDATVDSISDDLTTCTVSFEKYGNTEIVKVRLA